MKLNILSVFFILLLVLSVIFKLFLDIINYKHRLKNKNYIPEELSGFVDKEKLEKINLYSNDKLRLSLTEYFFDNLILLSILFLGLIPIYYDFLRGFTENIYIICLLFFGTYFTIIFLVGIPFNLYFNFMVEKKYGFNNMTLKIWILDSIKELIISFVFGTILLLPLTFLLYTFPSFWFVPVWGFLIVFSLFVQIIYPTIIAPLFNKFEPLKNEELKLKIENLLKECGFESSGLFEMDASKRSSHGNAYFTGFGKSKRIVLFDTLLKRHTDEEILAVLAHELGHFKHKHILKSLVVSSAFSLIGFFLANLFIDAKIIYDTFGLDQNAKIIGLFLLSILFTPISFFTTPFGAFFSRKNEYQADAFSKEKMKDPLPLINALKKLNVDNLSSLYPHPLYAWFYYSHPPLLYRIGALNKKTKE